MTMMTDGLDDSNDFCNLSSFLLVLRFGWRFFGMGIGHGHGSGFGLNGWTGVFSYLLVSYLLREL